LPYFATYYRFGILHCMKLTWLYLILVLLANSYWGSAQTCNTPGQNPSTAFPVCGTSTFIQTSVNLCGGRNLPNPKCNVIPLQDVNPYWYKFTCFKAGTLGFMITPNSATSDYDWQLYDVTNRDVNEVFTTSNMVISCNWSQYYGTTGTTTTAANLLECEGPVPQYSKMPDLIAGHNYLLLVSHFSNSQAGYKLEFNSGTAVITDTARPEMKELKVGCGGTQFYLKLNKKMKCSSIAANGSDWEFFNANVPIASAVGVGCNGGFETDSIIITAVNPVPSGTFALRAKKGADGNTMLDVCNEPLPEGQTLVVNVLPSTPPVIDSITPIKCAPTELEIVMDDAILCNSIATDGSDFLITGPSNISVAGAAQTSCVNGATKTIKLQLAAPIQVAGVYTVVVKVGSDGNTLNNVCQKQTVPGNSGTVVGYDTVSARFNYTVNSSCLADTVVYFNAGGNGITNWQWKENPTGPTGNQQTFRRVYNAPGERDITLIVSNGICTATSFLVFSTTDTRVKAAFEFPAFACPNDTIIFVDKSTGPVSSWRWNFGNGNTSTLQAPPRQFFSAGNNFQQVPITLIVGHVNGCKDTLTQRIQVPNNCYIAVPSGFTPNGDGLNDYLYPLNAFKATNLRFRVYNRYGQVVYETKDWTRKWDGKIQGSPQDAGTYAWTLEYTDENGKSISIKGTTVLIR
jgi:gliding motility-associated-like protein